MPKSPILRAPLLMLGGMAIAALPATVHAQTAGPAIEATFAAEALDEAALGAIAGREDTRQAALANQTAGVSQNSVGDNVRTGDARIDGQAFQNMSGLSVLNVNTGNNVAINAAMNVTIALAPAP